MSERFDDEHRGPAVADALQLHECWLQLVSATVDWPEPADPMGRSIEAIIRQTYPEEQQEQAIAENRRTIYAAERIVKAAKAGALPIWTRPIGEAEIPVARDALSDLDSASVKAGTYRPLNDRGWLFGRPLWVKRADWQMFLTTVGGSTTTLKPKRRGRRPGTGSFAVADAPLHAKMAALIADGTAKSKHDAARLVVEAGDGKGASPKSTIDRLARHYRSGE